MKILHKKADKESLRKDYSSYIILGAAVIFVAIFLAYPLIRTVLMAFIPKGEKKS